MSDDILRQILKELKIQTVKLEEIRIAVDGVERSVWETAPASD